jgi:hypothetical protein
LSKIGQTVTFSKDFAAEAEGRARSGGAMAGSAAPGVPVPRHDRDRNGSNAAPATCQGGLPFD